VVILGIGRLLSALGVTLEPSSARWLGEFVDLRSCREYNTASRRKYEPCSVSLPMPATGRCPKLGAVPDEPLTERERTTAVLLAYGHTNRDVAQRLRVSVRTAESERAHLMRKLGIARRAELVRWALERGLLR
jgi:DNA-binding NarL/FixJ family response regulator